jgi:transcriptional regulator with XRE-family HTH domain
VLTDVVADGSRSGSEVRALREQKQWTQQELAERLGVSRARVGQIETGTGAPMSADLLQRLNGLLGLSMELTPSGRRRRVRPRELTNTFAAQHGHPGLAKAREPFDQWIDNLGGTFAPMRFAIPDLDPRTMWSKVIEWATAEPTICRLKAIQAGNPTWWWGKRSGSAKQYHVKTLEFVWRRRDALGFGADRIYPLAKAEELLSDETVRRRFLEQTFCEGLAVGIVRRIDATPVPGMLLVDTAEQHVMEADEPGPLVVRLDGPDHEPTTSEFSAIAYDIEKGRADFRRLIRRAEWLDPSTFDVPCDLIPAERILELAELDDEDWEEHFREALGVDKRYLIDQLPAEIEKCLRKVSREKRPRR